MYVCTAYKPFPNEADLSEDNISCKKFGIVPVDAEDRGRAYTKMNAYAGIISMLFRWGCPPCNTC